MGNCYLPTEYGIHAHKQVYTHTHTHTHTDAATYTHTHTHTIKPELQHNVRLLRVTSQMVVYLNNAKTWLIIYN